MSDEEARMTPLTHPNPFIWWTHRRRLAYINQFMLMMMFAAMVLDRIPKENLELAATLCWVFGFNVIAYYGGNAIQEYAQAKK